MINSPLFHLTRDLLQPSAVIKPGNWGRVIRDTGPKHPAWNREEVLERVRRAGFPDKPSRFEAAYAFLSLEAAQYWRRHERQSDFLYSVEVVDLAATHHVGDLLGVQMIAGVDASPEAAARRYWSAGLPTFTTPDSTVIKELVVASSLRVIVCLP